jgi:hypothetical protein
MTRTTRFVRPRCRPEIFLATLVCALIPSASALAGVGEGNGEIGVELGAASMDSDLIDRTGYRLSVRFGRHLNEYLQFEGQYAVSQASEDLLPGVEKEATLRVLMFNYVLNLRPRRGDIVPYILLGLGVARLDLQAVGLSSDDINGAVQVAVGSRFFFAERGRAAFRVELSLVSNDAFEERYNHLNLAGGLTWRLGSE